MRIYGKCTHCNHENSMRTIYPTRTELAMRKGDHQAFKCDECRMNFKLHVDDLYAKRSNFMLILALIIVVVGSLISIFYIAPEFFAYYFDQKEIIGYTVGIIGLFGIIFTLIVKQDQRRVSSFNRARLKGFNSTMKFDQ